MQAYGSDRVREDGERWILSSRLDKGWNARVAKTLTSAEFPGTAILWHEQYFEVVAIDSHPAGGVQYTLERWRDNNAMRVTDRYDDASEAARVEESRARALRENQRKSANLLALLTGHLPAIVQNKIANELGVLPVRITIMSIVGVYAAIVAVALLSVSRLVAHEGLPPSLVLIAGFLTIENTIRWLIVWTQGRPIGSVIGWISYAIYHALTNSGPSPFTYEKGWNVKITAAPADVARHDAFIIREALVTLLTPREQARIAERYEYDYRRHSTNVALIILAGSILGVVTARHIVPAIVAAALGAEQIVRIATFRRGPAASVLRFLARPFVKRLLVA